MRYAVLVLFAAITVAAITACSPRYSKKTESRILAVMNAQTDAWNRGDIEEFLAGYWNSPDLLFASRGTFSRGWQPLLERYKKVYPEGKMGQLEFDDIEIHRLGRDAAWVAGKWSLAMDDSSPHGAFTLIFKRIGNGWKIVHDHSSGVPEGTPETTDN